LDIDNSVSDSGVDSVAVDGFSRSGDEMDCIPCSKAETKQEKKICEEKGSLSKPQKP
jgi:hypothetical protein